MEGLRFLGYKCRHFPIEMTGLRNGELRIDYEQVQQYDALGDIPIARFYPELDRQFPNSKFILTVRESPAWLDSCRRHFRAGRWANHSKIGQLHEDIYGTAEFDEHRYRLAYQRFVDGVGVYFRDREDDLLVLNICAGDGWKKLCPFVGERRPWYRFPKCNRRGKSRKYLLGRATGATKAFWRRLSAPQVPNHDMLADNFRIRIPR